MPESQSYVGCDTYLSVEISRKDDLLDSTVAERTKADFDPSGMLNARKKSWEALHRIIAFAKPGMTEEEVKRYSEVVLTEMGAERTWHRTWIRFGINTTKSYGTLSEPDTRLSENDILFVDMAPVFGGYEADVGATFVVGHDREMSRCSADVKLIFDNVRAKWIEDKATGAELYDYAEKRAKELGWVLNLKNSNGHRVSDFPHVLYYKGSVQGLSFTPKPFVWILEIQIRHPEKPFGAFYEDLLCVEN